MPEKRNQIRSLINRPVVLISMPAKGKIEIQGVGQALDISPKGMMLETSSPIYTDLITVRTSTNDGDSVYIDGRIMYSMLYSPGHYRTGIQFAGEAEKIGKFVTEMLKPLPIGK